MALKLPSRPTAPRGNIQVHIEEVQEMNTIATIKLRGENLDKKDLFGKSDPFLVISRVREGADYVPVLKVRLLSGVGCVCVGAVCICRSYRARQTEVIRKTLNPSWRSFDISTQRLCNGDAQRPLR